MKNLSAPWRIKYIKRKKPEGCIFCSGSGLDRALMVYEGEKAFILMNRFPYISGHMMVAPYRHVANIEDLDRRERLELFDLTDLAVRALKNAYGPQGFNIGMNLGKAAGAGIDDHLHLHIVPRWSGDTNFMSVLGEVRVIPEDLDKTRVTLRRNVKKIKTGGRK
ncbi:MAG TPA: HIT domain-containing protein [Syntrophales bacterium]|jgi:ATP adenylyltransferase|nr:HIT domain-containing protein [Syntrophales bacterium]HRT61459.1 HIT domain-containing protein [Syntrophales bacterium]